MSVGVYDFLGVMLFKKCIASMDGLKKAEAIFQGVEKARRNKFYVVEKLLRIGATLMRSQVIKACPALS